MKSTLKIRWTEEASNNLENIIIYLETNWSEKEIKAFFLKLEKQLELISVFPQAYPLSTLKKNVHKCVFLENLSIYYTIDNEYIVLLSIFDTRQNSNKNKI